MAHSSAKTEVPAATKKRTHMDDKEKEEIDLGEAFDEPDEPVDDDIL